MIRGSGPLSFERMIDSMSAQRGGPGGLPGFGPERYGGDSARQRLSLLFDEGSFVELDGFARSELEPSGVVCGFGTAQGASLCAFAQDGPMGRAHADKILKLSDLALKTGAPMIGIYDSRGLLLDEGIDALDACGEILAKVNNLSGVVPQISVILGPCVGVAAMLACSADFVVMEKEAEFYAVPPQYDAPEKAGSADDAMAAGTVQLVASGSDSAVAAAKKLLSLLPSNNLSALPRSEFVTPADTAELLREASHDLKSADVAAVAEAILDADSALSLYDGFGTGVFAAFGTLGGSPCGLLATRGEALSGDDCAKIARLVSVWDSFQIPVVTLVNTPGMAAPTEAPYASFLRDMAKLAHVYAEATAPKLAVITGRAYGAAYVALTSGAGADYTLAWPSAVISALPPRTAVAFQEGNRITEDRTREALEREYVDKKAGPVLAAEQGHIDDVIDPAATREALLALLSILGAKRVQRNPKKHGNIPF